MNLEDSLQNLSHKRTSHSPSVKDEKQRALFLQLKQKFITALSKLQSSETREIGIRQIRLLIDRNREPEHLRMYLAVMKCLKIQGTSSSTKEHQILVFSILAEILKENLVDPIDKPSPSRVKTCFRIVQILHPYFKQTTNTVQQACARVLIDLGKHVLGAQTPNPSLDTETFLTILFIPLASILKSGVDKASQSTASVCINEQIQYWRIHFQVQKYMEMLNAVCNQMLAVSLKLNCQYHEIFMSLQTLIQMKGLDFFIGPVTNGNNSFVANGGKIVQFVSKILGVINKMNSKAPQQTVSNFNSYMCKVNVCGIIEKIGELIRERPEIKAKLDQLDIIPALEKATRNRVIQVQMAASKAMKVWNGQILSSELKNSRPGSTPKIGPRSHIMSLQQARNNKKRQRSNSKQEKLKLERELNHIKEDLNKLVKGGWGPHNRANNFVKKNTGVGGGNCSKMQQSPSPKANNKSHKQHIQQLRDFIKKSSKQHGTKDKFIFYEQNQGISKKSNKRASQNPNSNNKNRNNSKSPENNQEARNRNQQNQQQLQFILQQGQGDQNVALPDQYQQYRQNQGENPYARDSDEENHANNKNDDQYKVRYDTEDKQWLKKNQQALNKIDSDSLSGIIDQKQMKELLKQQQQILDIQSKQNLKSNITVKGNQKEDQQSFRKNNETAGFRQVTFNNQQQTKQKSNKNINQNTSIEKKQKNQASNDKNISNQGKNKSQSPTPNSQELQNQRMVKKPRKAIDDDFIQQKPLQQKQQKKVQMQNPPSIAKSNSNPIKQQPNASSTQKNAGEQSYGLNRATSNPTPSGGTYEFKPTNLPSGVSFKDIDKVQISIDNSQKMSQSIPIDQIMNQSDFQGLMWNPFKKINENYSEQNSPKAQGFGKRKNSQDNETNPKKQLKQSNYQDSLMLSLSRGQQSRSKSPPKAQPAMTNSKKSQFSLNPNANRPNTNKFNSYTQSYSNEPEQQILDESKYEESMPQGQKLLNRQPSAKSTVRSQDYPNLSPYMASQQRQKIEEYYKRSVEHGQQLDQKVRSTLSNKGQPSKFEQSKSQVYQQMIKNPPKHISQRLDKASQLSPNPNPNIEEDDEPETSPMPSITDTWQQLNQLNQAYSLVFKMEDPLYLLRLMLITQTPLNKLTPANNRLLWERFLQIYNHRFIDNIFVQMFTTANRLGGANRGISKSLSIQQINDTLAELYELSGRTKGKLSFGAASLYNQIQEAINISNNN